MSQVNYNEEGDIDLTQTDVDISQDPQETINQEPEEVEVQEPAQPEPQAVEKTEEPEEPTSTKPSTEPDPSSLTPEPQPAPSKEPVVQQPEIDDQLVTKYLSEKLGKEVKLDDLLKEPETTIDPLEEDPALKDIYEWRKRTGRPVTDWVKFQKDYDSMSNLDVAREILQLRYPDLTPEELQLELTNFVASEDDLDEDKARKSLNLKKFASDGRKELNTLKTEFDKPLENFNSSVQPSISEEDKQKIEFYDKYQSQVQEQQNNVQAYRESISNEIQGFKSIPLKLSDDFSIDYNVTPENKGNLQEFMEMKHWYNPDGSYNHNAVVADSVFLQNKDKIIQMAYEQGIAKGKEEEDIESRNINLNQPRQTMDNANTQTDEIIVEGAENFTHQGTKIRFKH